MNELIEINPESNKPYNPTPAEARLLEVMLNPEHAGKSITAKCEIADIARVHYYDIMKKPEFVSLIKKSAIDLIGEKLTDVIGASIKCATNGGGRGFQDRRMLLEMCGLYTPEQRISGNFNLTALTNSEERRKRIDELEREIEQEEGT